MRVLYSQVQFLLPISRVAIIAGELVLCSRAWLIYWQNTARRHSSTSGSEDD